MRSSLEFAAGQAVALALSGDLLVEANQLVQMMVAGHSIRELLVEELVPGLRKPARLEPAASAERSRGRGLA